MRRNRLLPLALLAALAGCEASEVAPPTDYECFLTFRSERERARQDPFFVPSPDATLPDDMPIPKGFLLLPPKAGAPAAGRTLRYGGLSTVTETVAFYRGVLPAFGWRENSRDESRGRAALLFRKAGEEVRLDCSEGTPSNFVLLVIQLQRAGGSPS